MAEITVQAITDKSTWEEFLSGRQEANFLQSWYWGELYKQLGKPIERRGFYKNGQLVGVMLGIVEPARRARYLTVPAGPIIDWNDESVVQAFVEEVRELGRKHACAFVRVRPQIQEDATFRDLFGRLGFRPAKMHLHAELTSQLDITPDEQVLLGNMRKNTRYELKQAKKRGIKISSTQDPEAIENFYELQLETARRHGFVPYTKKLLKIEFELFAEADKAKLFSAHTKDGELIAQAFVVFYNNEAAYHYGASTELGRSEPGAYAIQWAAIKEAKKRGLIRYNFWGVVKPEQSWHRFYGVSVFKRGFKGDDVEYLHAHDLVLSWLRYMPNLLLETIRKKRRRL